MRYEIRGEPMPVVICHLEQGESMITESGSMAWMSPNLEMRTESGGPVRAAGRLVVGERKFQTTYTARGSSGMIAFSSGFPGTIRAVQITRERPIAVQKSAFLAAEKGVELSVFFHRRIMAGLFSGEGFLMQKISGEGMAFLELDGSVVEYHLEAGEQMVVGTGNLAMADCTCTVDVRSVKGVRNKLFGGEGFFNTVVTGPGRIVLQTMPLSVFAGAIASRMGRN